MSPVTRRTATRLIATRRAMMLMGLASALPPPAARAAEPVRDRSPYQSHSPAHHEQREQQAAVIAHVGRCRGNAGTGKHIAQGRYQHQRKDERIHPVHGPAAPGSPESSLLAGCERNTGHGRFDHRFDHEIRCAPAGKKLDHRRPKKSRQTCRGGERQHLTLSRQRVI